MRATVFWGVALASLFLSSCGKRGADVVAQTDREKSAVPRVAETVPNSADSHSTDAADPHPPAGAHPDAPHDAPQEHASVAPAHHNAPAPVHHGTTDQHGDGHAASPASPDHSPPAKVGVQHTSTPDAATDDAENLAAGEIFNRRVLPILRSDKASSCRECHFAGVELSNYLREDQATTFAALRDEGLIDVQTPDESKILQFIRRHTDNTDPLLDKVRQNEFQALRTWIRAAVREPELLAAKPSEINVGTELPVEVVRHLRRDRVLSSFVENIWSEVGRCINCHSPDRNERLVREHGEQMSWIRPGDPAGTLQQAVEQGIIDTDDPEQSLILRKPLVLVKHGGGPKFALGSRTDKNFRRFLNDYAAVVKRKYAREDQLPQPSDEVVALTGQHLRITDLPAELDAKLLKVDLYRWTGDGWSETPWGTAENPINGKQNVWQSMVFGVAPRGSERAGELQTAQEFQLSAGRYLLKIYVDRQDKTKGDRDYDLGDADLYGQVEIDGSWPPGYQPPKIVQAPRSK